MGKYNVNEGNQIGYMPTEFDANGNLVEQKLVADGDLTAGQVVYVSDEMKVKATAAASAAVLGVAMFDAKNGEPVAVECEGLFKLTAAGWYCRAAQRGKVHHFFCTDRCPCRGGQLSLLYNQSQRGNCRLA